MIITDPKHSDFDEIHAKERAYKAFEDFILTSDHPCLMAQTAFEMDQVDLNIYNQLGTMEAAESILRGLEKYLMEYDFDTNNYYTFLAVFKNPETLTEKEFETLLWQQLQQIHELDNEAWDPAVEQDANNDQFSYSVLGKAFYVVGMHPNSSRKARQSPLPSIAFNLHWQFEQLREMGAYESLRDRIRERDKKLQGSVNPMMQDFGSSSEARQYSGRKVEEDWKCPFHAKS